MATQSEIDAGAAALRSYIESVNFFEGLIAPETALDGGAKDIIEAADKSNDQSQGTRLTAGTAALRAALNSIGYGSQVTDQQCASGAAAVLVAIAKLRAQVKP